MPPTPSRRPGLGKTVSTPTTATARKGIARVTRRNRRKLERDTIKGISTFYIYHFFHFPLCFFFFFGPLSQYYSEGWSFLKVWKKKWKKKKFELGKEADVILSTPHPRLLLGFFLEILAKGDIRRLARRGGVKRISGAIYDDIRHCLVTYLREVCIICPLVSLRSSGRRYGKLTGCNVGFKELRDIYGTCTEENNYSRRCKLFRSPLVKEEDETYWILSQLQVIFALKRQGRPIYG